MNSSNNQLWVVACCFNEAAGITQFIEAVLAQPSVDRLLLIDDGSRDDTTGAIRQWMEAQPLAPVTLVELTRNFGKEAAMLAGLDQAVGRCGAVIQIDSDLQHPPELITEMVEHWRAGAEMVTAVRDERDQESQLKILSASGFYRLFNRMVDSIELTDGAGDYRLLSAPVVQALTELREKDRFSLQRAVPLDWLPQRQHPLPQATAQQRHLGMESAPSLALCPRWHLQLFRLALEGVDLAGFGDLVAEPDLRLLQTHDHLGLRHRRSRLDDAGGGDLVPRRGATDRHWHPWRIRRAHLYGEQASPGLFRARHPPRSRRQGLSLTLAPRRAIESFRFGEALKLPIALQWFRGMQQDQRLLMLLAKQTSAQAAK